MKITPILLFPVLLAGCYTIPDPVDGNARFGERTFVDGPYVEPIALIEDSRCPINARCTWAGRLRITARITTGPGTELRELTLGEPVSVADGALELISAAPLRKAGQQIDSSHYYFKFRFDGGY